MLKLKLCDQLYQARLQSKLSRNKSPNTTTFFTCVLFICPLTDTYPNLQTKFRMGEINAQSIEMHRKLAGIYSVDESFIVRRSSYAHAAQHYIVSAILCLRDQGRKD